VGWVTKVVCTRNGGVVRRDASPGPHRRIELVAHHLAEETGDTGEDMGGFEQVMDGVASLSVKGASPTSI